MFPMRDISLQMGLLSTQWEDPMHKIAALAHHRAMTAWTTQYLAMISGWHNSVMLEPMEQLKW